MKQDKNQVFDTIIFDFDGTLADSQRCGVMATQKAFEEKGFSVPSESTINYYMGIPIEKSFQEMADSTLSDAELQSLIITFRKYYKEYEESHLVAFPDIVSLLSELQVRSKNCFVLSSKKTNVLQRNLILLNLHLFFREIIGSDKVSNYKPHPEGIEYILNTYKIEKESTLMVGDAIFDLQMGRSARVSTCAVTWGSHSEAILMKENPDFIIHSPLELLKIV
ncbi:HAD family hydrolase [Capnocytophaga felis]|uniref:Haloacid dehalogenase n=1 Tax=Capnocytophaga felis TaxID=2267611 RepID=A0A5M4B9I2_9FLAO|nr:HAD family hydrolase [Capnocytophaga felis]GET45942.1 haloacid dehalogenase [Capnocytophaga felis]GET49206.1 haloacid dehalogenase [Capnocytophaga felis]